MYRFTTPTHTFTVPFDTSTIDKLIITYQQSNKTVLEKTESEVTLEEDKVIVTLTQEETKLFSPVSTKIQMRVKIGKQVMASKVVNIIVGDVLNKEIM